MISPHGRDLLIWMVVFTILNLTVVALRFYTVTHVKKRAIRPDDVLIILSVMAMLAMEGTTFWGKPVLMRCLSTSNRFTDYAPWHSHPSWLGSSNHDTFVA
jgi:hypothetical protein